MKAVVLAAGKSTRTWPLTLTRPKPLLMVANKTLIEHNLDQLQELVKEVIIIIGYKKDMIKEKLKDYKKIKIRFVEQKRQLGTAHALVQIKEKLGRFILLMGDDLYFKQDIKRCLRYSYSVLGKPVPDYKNFGILIVRNNVVKDIVEKPSEFISNLANTACYVLDDEIFSVIKRLKKSVRKEYELTDAIKHLLSYGIRCVLAKQWFPIVYPPDLLKADSFLRKGKTIIGKNSKIEGKIIDSSIGNNCVVKGYIKNSIIMDNCRINGYVEDSIIATSVIFEGCIKSAQTIIKVKNKIIKTKIGAVIADNSKLVSVRIKPGTMIWPNKSIENKILEGNVK